MFFLAPSFYPATMFLTTQHPLPYEVIMHNVTKLPLSHYLPVISQEVFMDPYHIAWSPEDRLACVGDILPLFGTPYHLYPGKRAYDRPPLVAFAWLALQICRHIQDRLHPFRAVPPLQQPSVMRKKLKKAILDRVTLMMLWPDPNVDPPPSALTVASEVHPDLIPHEALRPRHCKPPPPGKPVDIHKLFLSQTRIRQSARGKRRTRRSLNTKSEATFVYQVSAPDRDDLGEYPTYNAAYRVARRLETQNGLERGAVKIQRIERPPQHKGTLP